MTETNTKKTINFLSAGHFLTDLYSGFLNPIMPFIAAKIGITMAIATALISISNLTSSLSQPFFGYFADKIQKRFFIFWGMMMASVFLSLIGISNNVLTLIICLILGNMGVSFFHPQATGMVSDSVKKDSNSKEISIFIFSGTIGYAMGPAVSSGITQICGLEKLPFACIVGVIFAFMMLKNTPKVRELTEKKMQISLFEAVKKMFQNKPVTVLVFASIVKSFVVSSFQIILPFYWKSLGFDVSKIGLILLLFMTAGATGIILSPYIERKIGIKNVFYISLLAVLPLGTIFYFTNGQGIIAFTAFILIGFVSFLAVPVNMALAQRLMPEFKSMISGFIGGFSWGVIGIILPLISLLSEKIGIMNILFAMTFIPFLFSYFIKYLKEEA